MDSTSHYREAERLLRHLDRLGPHAAAEVGPLMLQMATVHATLALAAVTALSSPQLSPPEYDAWFRAASVEAPIAPETNDEAQEDGDDDA